jgi:hypothetical protein
MDDHRAQSPELPSTNNDDREPYEPPVVESLGGVYGQTQQTL